MEQCSKEFDAAREAGDQKTMLERLERGLYLRRRLYKEGSSEVSQACHMLCETCNCAATTMLQKSNLKGARELLRRAEETSDKNDADRAVTWNNLACYYRRTGKLRSAVTFLERALAIEEHIRNADAAQTHLNLCATLSQLGRHADASYHAQSALIRMYEILSPSMLQGKLDSVGRPGDERHEQLTVLCIAYHNLAVELEYLKNHEGAVCAHAEGLKWASKYLPDHQLVNILRDSVTAVKSKLPPGSAAVTRAQEALDSLAQTQPVGGKEAGSDTRLTPRQNNSSDDLKGGTSKSFHSSQGYSQSYGDDDSGSENGE
jgi:tetratricopeptide (TPR) repeat protein